MPAFCSRLFRSFLIASSLPTLAFAQASFTPFGSTCFQGMTMSAANLPRLGQSLDIRYTGPIGSTFVGQYDQVAQPVLMLGTSATQAGSVPLPVTLPLGLTNGAVCDIAVSPDAMALMPLVVLPVNRYLLPIPNQPQLLGFTFHLQWLLVIERSTFGQVLWTRLYTSNAATAVVGV